MYEKLWKDVDVREMPAAALEFGVKYKDLCLAAIEDHVDLLWLHSKRSVQCVKFYDISELEWMIDEKIGAINRSRGFQSHELCCYYIPNSRTVPHLDFIAVEIDKDRQVTVYACNCCGKTHKDSYSLSKEMLRGILRSANKCYFVWISHQQKPTTSECVELLLRNEKNSPTGTVPVKFHKHGDAVGLTTSQCYKSSRTNDEFLLLLPPNDIKQELVSTPVWVQQRQFGKIVGKSFMVTPQWRIIDGLKDAIVATIGSQCPKKQLLIYEPGSDEAIWWADRRVTEGRTADAPYLFQLPLSHDPSAPRWIWVQQRQLGEPASSCFKVFPVTYDIDGLKDAIKAEIGTGSIGNPALMTIFEPDIAKPVTKQSTTLRPNEEETPYLFELPT